MIKQKLFFSLNEKPPKLSISWGDYYLKQHSTVEYIGCQLDSNVNGEPMDVKFLKRLIKTE